MFSGGDDPFYDPYNMFQNEEGNEEFRQELANFDHDPEFFTNDDIFKFEKQYIYKPDNYGGKLDDINEQDELDYSPHINEKKPLTEVNNISKEKTRYSTNFKKDGPIFKIFKEFKNENLIQAGRKRKNEESGKHDKYSYDNVTRKIKTKLFESILTVLNGSIEKVQIENPKKYSKKILYSKDFFLKVDQEIIKDINVENNKKLLKTQLKDIFSEKVSKKVERYGLDYNRKLVEKIYEEKIQEKTIAILEKTFLECLEHFRGTKFYKELEGLEKEYKNIIQGFRDCGETDDYIEIFEDLVKRFEDYYENKKSRVSKKNKTKDSDNDNEN